MLNNKNFYQLETLLEPVFIASNYMADDSRPLAEMTAINQLKLGVEYEMRRCPYAGSRFEKDMNVSALPGLSQQIKGIISDTINLRAEYLEYIGDDTFSLRSFWFFTRTLDSIPAYLVRKFPQPMDKSCLPARVSAMFKAAQGLHLAPEVMLLDGASPDSTISVDGLIDFIELRNLFMEDNRACAGPPSMVKSFIASAVDGEGKKSDIVELGAFLGAGGIRGLFKYADSVSRVFASKVLFEASCRIFVQDIVDDLADEKLVEISKKVLSRFGSLKSRKYSTIEMVKINFQRLGDSPETGAVLPRLVNESRLNKMISLRNPSLSKAICLKATDTLIRSLGYSILWMEVFTKGQQSVLDALGYSYKLGGFSLQDFSGLGYMPAEILGEWLNINVVANEGYIFVKAGASSERFDWQL